mgnify:CR=1 FL=1
MAQQAYQTSQTGLQSFAEASPDYELAPIGLGSMQGQAQKLAEYGRNGDIYIVHAAEGETVIPMEVLDANPQVKEMLFEQMRGMGLNPSEYVVGSELNSRNPVTGMPEFFFKGIFKAIKSVVKSVVKIVKKAAPIVLPIAAAMFGVPFLSPAFFGAGSMGAAFLGSGIGTLIGGGSLGDALKAGVISGATAGFMGGVKGSLGGTDIGNFLGVSKDATFGSGLSKAFMNPGAASFSQNVSNFGSFLSSPSKETGGAYLRGEPTQPPQLTSPLDPGWDTLPDFSVPTTSAGTAGTAGTAGAAAADPGLGNIDFNKAGRINFDELTLLGNPPTPAPLADQAAQWTQEFEPTMTGETLPDSFYEQPSWFETEFPELQKTVTKAGDYLVGGGDSKAVWAQKGLDAQNAVEEAGLKRWDASSLTELNSRNPAAAKSLYEQASAAGKAAGSPGMLATYGPSAALAGTAAYAFGAFDAPEQEPGETDEEYAARWAEWNRNATYEDNRADYDVADLDPYKYRPAPASVPLVADGGMMYRQPQNMNYGGAAQYPRREMLVEGPGTERSDDIPAMLSDGEFVLNARSVRGADPTGQGNRYRGAQNLYGMMRNFEMKA